MQKSGQIGAVLGRPGERHPCTLPPPPGGTFSTRGKRNNAALICLARRHRDVLFAMFRDKTAYQHRPTTA